MIRPKGRAWCPFSRLQLGKVFDRADHLAGVGVLIVVPGDHLDQALAVAGGADQGLGGVEQGAVGHADDVGGDDLVLVVAEGLGVGGGLHGGVHVVLGEAGLVHHGEQQGGGAGGGGHALGSADELAVELGDDQADGLGGAGGVGHDAQSAGTGAAEVTLALGAVQDHLVAGVGVDGAHDAGLDGGKVVEGLGHGSQAVGGAAGGGDDLVLGGQGLVVDVVDDGGQSVAGGGGDDPQGQLEASDSL